MSEIADSALCEKFEANIFAKRRCQNCFRTFSAHQQDNQAPEENTLISPGCGDGTEESSLCDQWDPLCILVPQCELYVCVGSEDRTESWQENLEYTQLSSRTEEELEETSACHDISTVTSTETDTNAPLSEDWEMTRLLESIAESVNEDMRYYASQKQQQQSEILRSDQPRRAEIEAPRSCGKTEPWSCLKTEPRAMNQDLGDSRRKHQAESGYFSLERRKSEPSRASSPPRVGHSALPGRGDAAGAGGWPPSSISSADSDRSWRTSGSPEGRHGLMKQEYTVLADLPKPKRLNHQQAFEKERSSFRTRSPGRAEVERIFGHERRKSETLGAFKALEEGLLERLDSKSLKLAKEGRLVRRKSSPTLRRDVSKRLPWEPEQPSKSLRMGRPEQRSERSSRSQAESLRSGSPTQQLERESRSRGVSPHSAVPLERESRSRGVSPHSAVPLERESRSRGVSLRSAVTTERDSRSRGVSLHLAVPPERDSRSRGVSLHSAVTTERDSRSGGVSLHSAVPPERDSRSRGVSLHSAVTTERDSRSRGVSLHSVVPPERESRSRGVSLHSAIPPGTENRSRGVSLHSVAPLERETRSRGASLHTAVPLERERRKREEPMHHQRVERERPPLRAMSHGKQTDSSRKSQPESLHHKGSGKNMDTKWKSCLDALHVAKPGKSLDKSQVSHRRSSQDLSKPQERYKDSDRKARGKPLLPMDTAEPPRDCREAVCALSPGSGMAASGRGGLALSSQRRVEGSWGAQEETRRSPSPGRSMGTGLKSHGEAGSVFSSGRCTGGSQRESGLSLSPERGRERSWSSSGDVRCSSPGRPMESGCSCSKQARGCALPVQHPGQWESPARNQRASTDCDWPDEEESSNPFSLGKEEDWKGYVKSLCPTSLPVTEQKKTGKGELPHFSNSVQRSETTQKSREGPLCHEHPMQLSEREQISQEECLHPTEAGQQPMESDWENQRSSTGWIEGERKNQVRCPDLMRLEKQLEENDCSAEEKLLHQRQQDEEPPLTSPCSSKSQDLYLSTSKTLKPDLLNFKKGWMSILNDPGEWMKHWFVLTDSSLRYYRDSNAEEADDLDGEIDLRSCTDVTEYSVQRNYGFQIHTKDGVFTLSAMTSGIRRNWIEALRKSVRPASVPDVTKLADCNKENSFRSYGSQKSSSRLEEQRPGTGSEVIPRGSNRKADGQRHAFDYVELSPLQQGPLNRGSLQRTRGNTRAADGTVKREELERDLALRSEERRKWFESPASGVLQTDGLTGDHGHKAAGQEPSGLPLSEAQRNRLSEEIEKKWQELERLPLKDSKRVPLMTLLNQGKGSHNDATEALEKEIQVLRSQLESLHVHSEAKSSRDGQAPRGYISQEACEHSLAEMETSHQQVMAELQRHHQREIERLQKEKERLLSEEAAATAAAIEALKKAHREELNKELGRTRSFQKGGLDPDAFRRQHQSDVESLKRELQVLSEQYSQKCLEIGDLVQKAEDQEQTLQHCQQEGKDLLRQNQELQRRLSEEIGQLRAFIAAQASRDGASHNNERNSCELEVLLRVKENELQYLKQEVQCLREELQMMQKDKRFASGKYQDVYVELNHIKRRSEREIEQLKEHLRLAMAALQEKETLHNSIG